MGHEAGEIPRHSAQRTLSRQYVHQMLRDCIDVCRLIMLLSSGKGPRLLADSVTSLQHWGAGTHLLFQCPEPAGSLHPILVAEALSDMWVVGYVSHSALPSAIWLHNLCT